MSQVCLGRPEFVPGTPPGHPTAKFLYVIFLYRFFSLQICGGVALHSWNIGRPQTRPKNLLRLFFLQKFCLFSEAIYKKDPPKMPFKTSIKNNLARFLFIFWGCFFASRGYFLKKSPAKGTGKMVPRENGRKVSKNFLTLFLTFFDVSCPARKLSKSAETCFDTFWQFVTFFDVASFRRPLLQSAEKKPSVEVAWAWEKESRGQKPKSRKKVSKKSPGPGSQKSEKSLEKGPKSLQKPIFGLFFDFSDLFRDFFRTFGARPRETFFETFFRLFGFGPRDSFSQVHGTSSLQDSQGVFIPTCARDWQCIW